MKLKTQKPEIDVCIVEKSADLGNHNLSGAVLEPEPLHSLLDSAAPGWQDTDIAKDVLANIIDKDNIMFLLGKKLSFNIFFAVNLAKMFRLGFGQMIHKSDYCVSISKLTKWLGQIAKELSIEILTGFAVQDIIMDNVTGRASGVNLIRAQMICVTRPFFPLTRARYAKYPSLKGTSRLFSRPKKSPGRQRMKRGMRKRLPVRPRSKRSGRTRRAKRPTGNR